MITQLPSRRHVLARIGAIRANGSSIRKRLWVLGQVAGIVVGRCRDKFAPHCLGNESPAEAVRSGCLQVEMHCPAFGRKTESPMRCTR